MPQGHSWRPEAVIGSCGKGRKRQHTHETAFIPAPDIQGAALAVENLVHRSGRVQKEMWRLAAKSLVLPQGKIIAEAAAPGTSDRRWFDSRAVTAHSYHHINILTAFSSLVFIASPGDSVWRIDSRYQLGRIATSNSPGRGVCLLRPAVGFTIMKLFLHHRKKCLPANEPQVLNWRKDSIAREKRLQFPGTACRIILTRG